MMMEGMGLFGLWIYYLIIVIVSKIDRDEMSNWLGMAIKITIGKPSFFLPFPYPAVVRSTSLKK
jgi:hypothetical protein